MAKDAFGAKVKERVNWPITAGLILLALIVIIFPLYMAVRIAVADKMPTAWRSSRCLRRGTSPTSSRRWRQRSSSPPS